MSIKENKEMPAIYKHKLYLYINGDCIIPINRKKCCSMPFFLKIFCDKRHVLIIEIYTRVCYYLFSSTLCIKRDHFIESKLYIPRVVQILQKHVYTTKNEP